MRPEFVEPLEEKIKCKAEYKCKNKEKYNVDANGRRLNSGLLKPITTVRSTMP